MPAHKITVYLFLTFMIFSLCTIGFNTFTRATPLVDFKTNRQIHFENMEHVRARSFVARHTNSPIRHFIVICQENHSFDNYFGTYPTAKGFLPLPGTPTVNGIPAGAYNILNNGKKVYPYTLSPLEATTQDTDHGYEAEIKSWNGGKMNRFAAISLAHNSRVGRLSLAHYDYQTLPAYWDYAQHFSLADNWFQPIFGPTTPNVLYLFAAQAGTRKQPITESVDPTGYSFTYKNIGDELSAKNVSWIWYQNGMIRGVRIQDNPLPYFRKYTFGQYRHHLRDLAFFQTDLSEGKLPAITFIKADGKDEHPGQDIRIGMNFVVSVVNEIMNSPAWQDTAIIITYDECGGFWDHVAPKQIPPGPDGMRGDGPRVPTLVISPYAKENYVSHQNYDTSSILRFIEWNWDLPPLNHRDATASNLLDFFQFQNPNYTRFLLPTNLNHPSACSIQVKLNNFPVASSGFHKPMIQNGHVWMNIEDFARNLNGNIQSDNHELTVVWQNYNVKIPISGHYLTINKHVVRLKNPVSLHYASHIYVPIDEIARHLGIQVAWKNRWTLQLTTNNYKKTIKSEKTPMNGLSV